MGDIADGIINGYFDEITGEYIGEGGGFPRSRKKEEEPRRLEYAKLKLSQLGFQIKEINRGLIKFEFKGEMIKFYPYTGWATGKTITDGRGIDNLLKQIKP